MIRQNASSPASLRSACSVIAPHVDRAVEEQVDPRVADDHGPEWIVRWDQVIDELEDLLRRCLSSCSAQSHSA